MTADDPATVLAQERQSAADRAAALERDLSAIIEASGQANADDEHDPEGATIAFERQHVAALLDQARSQLTAVDAAIARLAAGQYGRCERCGQPIASARLAARPTAATCIRCATGRSG
jgi:DnaK suppressor protein